MLELLNPIMFTLTETLMKIFFLKSFGNTIVWKNTHYCQVRQDTEVTFNVHFKILIIAPQFFDDRLEYTRNGTWIIIQRAQRKRYSF